MFFWLNLLLTGLYLFTAVEYIIIFFTSSRRTAQTARLVLFLSIGLHLALLIWAGFIDGRMPLTTVFEAMSVLSFALVLAYFIIELRAKRKAVGSFVFPIVFIFQLISSLGSSLPRLWRTHGRSAVGRQDLQRSVPGDLRPTKAWNQATAKASRSDSRQ